MPIADQIYLRMQAQDLLVRSLQEQDPAPLRQLIDQLLAQQPPEFELLRDLLNDIHDQLIMLRARRFDCRNEVVAVFRDGYTIDISAYAPPSRLDEYGDLTADGLFVALGEQAAALDEEDAVLLSEMFEESTALVASLSAQIRIVETLLNYLKDWLLALAAEAARESDDVDSLSQPGRIH